MSKTTAVAINPGTLSDSRALRTNTQQMFTYMSKLISLKPLLPLFQYKDPTMRSAAEAGVDVVDLAVDEAYVGQRGYFTLLKQDVSSQDSLDEGKQQKLWLKTVK